MLISYFSNKNLDGLGDINIQKISKIFGFSYPPYRGGGDKIIEQQKLKYDETKLKCLGQNQNVRDRV